MSEIDVLSGETLHRALLERLRFERAMGIECVHPLPLARSAAVSAAGIVSAPSARSVLQPVPQRGVELRPVASGTVTQPVSTGQPASAAPSKRIDEAGEPRLLDASARWADLEARAMGCVACALHQGRNKVVFGTGHRTADLLFVGEGPGADEDLKGEPFVGHAGQLLDKIIVAMGLQRENVYICNVVKCRPPDNRTPLPDEVGACSPFLFEQVELVAPKVIVTLGGPATKALLNTVQGIVSIRGRWGTFKGISVMPTYHPAFLLRSYTEENRRAVWDDMKAVMKKLGDNS